VPATIKLISYYRY